MPPRRGDCKGTVERTQGTLESRHISMFPGYVKNAFKFTDPRMKRIIEKAKKSAKLTVAELEELLILAILDFNSSKHPTLQKPRISVYRKGLELAPMVLPTGMRQVRSTFALTYQKKKVTREGVRVENFNYNSPELNELYRTSDATVDVKLDPDDIRAVLIYCKELKEPIEAALTTHAFPEPITLELAKAVFRNDVDSADLLQSADDVPEERFLARLHEIQNSAGANVRLNRSSAHVQAVVHASALPPVSPPAPKTMDNAEFEAMFGGREDSSDV